MGVFSSSGWYCSLLVVLALGWSLVPCATCTPLSATESPEFIVDQTSGRILDLYGRERIFHGLNVVVKDSPWQPWTDHFDFKMSMSEEDIKLLGSLGMNVIRLGVMWPGVEPERGVTNGTYLEVMRTLVRRLAQAGIYSLIEMHQDVFVDRFCGEGVPTWLLMDQQDASNGNNGQLAMGSDREKAPLESVVGGSRGSSRATSSRKLMQAKTGGNVGRVRGGNGEAGGQLSMEDVAAGETAMVETRETQQSAGSSLKLGGDKEEGGARSGALDLSLPCFITGVCKKPWEYAETFPEPLAPRYLPDEDSHGMVNPTVPSQQQCLSHAWGTYHFTYAVSRAFQELYQNTWGWADAMANYWSTLAQTFKGEPGVLGYELINEPWVGDQYSDPFLLLPGVSDRKNLQPFYDRLQAAIWQEDQKHLLFFESVTFDNIYCGFTRVPGGEQYANMSVLAYHYYKPPNLGVQQAFTERARESKRLGCGSFLTEFGLPSIASSKVTRRSGRPDMGQAAALVEESLRRRGQTSDAPQVVPSQAAGTDSSLVPDALEQDSSRQTRGGSDGSGQGHLTQGSTGQVVSGQESLGQVYLDAMAQVQAEAARMRQVEADGRAARVAELELAEPKRSDLEIEHLLLMLEAEEVANAADSYVQSWIGWEYKAFINKTGSNYGPFNIDGSINVDVARMLARTYPQAVAGSITSFSFDTATAAFTLSYVAAPAMKRQVAPSEGLSTTTEVWFHREFYYPLGVEAMVDPPGVELTEEDNLILLCHGPEVAGLPIQLTLLPRVAEL